LSAYVCSLSGTNLFRFSASPVLVAYRGRESKLHLHESSCPGNSVQRRVVREGDGGRLDGWDRAEASDSELVSPIFNSLSRSGHHITTTGNASEKRKCARATAQIVTSSRRCLSCGRSGGRVSAGSAWKHAHSPLEMSAAAA
jgi:hypothetical protein